MSKKMTTARKSSRRGSKTGSLKKPLSSAISEHSLIQDVRSYIKGLRISSQPDSLASPFPSQGSEEERPTNETSGLTLSEPFALYDQDTASWKTCQVSLLTNTLEPYSESWPKAGIVSNGSAYRLLSLELRIGEIGSGFWATPNVMDSLPPRSGEALEKNLYRGDHANPNKRRRNRSGNLREQIMNDGQPVPKMWPTPKSRDWRSEYHTPGVLKRESPDLNKVIGGQLNPTWVEWLQGWPIGWTSLEPIGGIIGLGWDSDPADTDEIPRVAKGVKDRVNRLKALGNGQVPQCVAAAWGILKGEGE